MKSKAINTQTPWYWICSGKSPEHCGFSCKEATQNKRHAKSIIKKRNKVNKVEGEVWYIKERFEHPDRDFKQYRCPACANLMSDKELDATWDWGGPHCNECGCTGMEMFSAVTAHAPIQNAAGKTLADCKAIIASCEKFIKSLRL